MESGAEDFPFIWFLLFYLLGFDLIFCLFFSFRVSSYCGERTFTAICSEESRTPPPQCVALLMMFSCMPLSRRQQQNNLLSFLLLLLCFSSCSCLLFFPNSHVHSCIIIMIHASIIHLFFVFFSFYFIIFLFLFFFFLAASCIRIASFLHLSSHRFLSTSNFHCSGCYIKPHHPSSLLLLVFRCRLWTHYAISSSSSSSSFFLLLLLLFTPHMHFPHVSNLQELHPQSLNSVSY